MGSVLVPHPARQKAQGEKSLGRPCQGLMLICFALLFLIGCDSPKPVPGSNSPNSSEPSRREIIGERLYQKYCAGCHGETGEGDGMHGYTLNPPPADHADSSYMNSLTDEYLFEVISRGGAAAGKSPEMPAWKQVLNNNEIENVIVYIRTLPLHLPGRH